jgi:hypothetical protein
MKDGGVKQNYITNSVILVSLSILISSCSSSPGLGGGGSVSSSSALSAATNYTSAYIGTLIYVPAGTFQYDTTSGDLERM